VGEELDANKIRLLAILSLYTKPAGVEDDYDHYIKDYALLSIIYDLIIKGILDYDYSSRLVLWKGAYVFMNISQEAVSDLEFLVNKGFVQRIKFSTEGHLYVIGYSITEKGLKLLDEHKDHLDIVRNSLKCECGGVMSIIVEDDDAYYVCCNRKIPIGCLSTEDISYETEPVFV